MAGSDIKKLYTLKIREEYRQLVQPSGEDAIKRAEEDIRLFGCGELSPPAYPISHYKLLR